MLYFKSLGTEDACDTEYSKGGNMKTKFYLFVFLAAFLAISSCGGGSGTDADLPSGGGELLLVSDGLGSDGIIRLEFGESFSFSVSYNGEELSDFDCRILDSDNDPVVSGAGTLVCEDGEGRFTAPRSVPAAGSYLKLQVSVELLNITLQSDIAKSSGAVTAEIEILLPCEYTSNCTAASSPLCMYSQCVPYSSIGVNRSQDSCVKQSDCSGDDMCLSFDRNSCDSGYCVDVEDVFTLSASNCEDGGGVMVEAESDDYSVCVTGDVMACVSEDDHVDGPNECNVSEVEDCSSLGEAGCTASYIISVHNGLKYNCYWNPDEEYCYIDGEWTDAEYACIE